MKASERGFFLRRRDSTTTVKATVKGLNVAVIVCFCPTLNVISQNAKRLKMVQLVRFKQQIYSVKVRGKMHFYWK